MPNFTLDGAVTLKENSDFNGIALDAKTIPAVCSFFESKGATVTKNSDGTCSIDYSYSQRAQAFLARSPLAFSQEEMCEYVGKIVPPAEQSTQPTSKLESRLMSVQYSMHSAKNLANDSFASVRANQATLLKVMAGVSAVTTVLGLATYAYSKHKAKMQ